MQTTIDTTRAQDSLAETPVGRLRRILRWELVALAIALVMLVVGGASIEPQSNQEDTAEFSDFVLTVGLFAALGLMVVIPVHIRRLRRFQYVLRNYGWRDAEFTKTTVGSGWEISGSESQLTYRFPATEPSEFCATIAGPDGAVARRRRWTAVQGVGSDRIKLVRGPLPAPRRPSRGLRHKLFGRWIVDAPARPEPMHDVPVQRCSIGLDGLRVEHVVEDRPLDWITVVLYATRRTGWATCQVWDSDGGLFARVARDGRDRALLDLTGRIVVDGAHRFGRTIYSAADGKRLASNHERRLTLRHRTLVSHAMRSSWALESPDGERVALVVVSQVSRGSMTVVVSLNARLSQIERAVVLLWSAEIVDLPPATVVSS